MGKTDETRTKEIAARIRSTLEERGMSQADLARAIGVEPTSLWRYLEGRTGIDKKIVPIARALGVDALWLEAGGDDRGDPQAREIELFIRENGPTLRPPLTPEEERWVRVTPHHRITRGKLLDMVMQSRGGLTAEEMAASSVATQAARAKGDALGVPRRSKR